MITSDNVIGWKNEKSLKHIEKVLNYALFLTTSKKKGVKTPYNSVSNVQLAFRIIDRLNINATSIYAKGHIITIGSAIDFVQNDYWINHSYKSFNQLMDLKTIRKHYGFAVCYYHVLDDKYCPSHRRVQCDLATFGDLYNVIHRVRNHVELEKKLQALTVA